MWRHDVERNVFGGYLIQNGVSPAEADGVRRMPQMHREYFDDEYFTHTPVRLPRSPDVTAPDTVTAWVEVPVERCLLERRIVSAARAVGWSS